MGYFCLSLITKGYIIFILKIILNHDMKNQNQFIRWIEYIINWIKIEKYNYDISRYYKGMVFIFNLLLNKYFERFTR